MEPRNCLTRDIRDYGVMKIDKVDSSRQAFFGDIPLGRKCQPPGPKCSDAEHAEGLPNMYVDKYRGRFGEVYVDRVCTVCNRRVMIRRP